MFSGQGVKGLVVQGMGVRIHARAYPYRDENSWKSLLTNPIPSSLVSKTGGKTVFLSRDSKPEKP